MLPITCFHGTSEGMKVELIRVWLNKNQPYAKEKLAVAVGVGSVTLNKILNHGHVPKVDNLKKFAAVLGVTLDELVSDDPEAA